MSEWHRMPSDKPWSRHIHAVPVPPKKRPAGWARRNWYPLLVGGLTIAVWGVLLLISTL